MRRANLRRIALGSVLLGLGALGCSQTRAPDVVRDRPAGVRQGAVELNTANRKQLARLPGISQDDAARIVQSRPYGNKRGLLKKQVLTQAQFDQIRDRVYVSQARDDDQD
jgi:hypothetical protein